MIFPGFLPLRKLQPPGKLHLLGVCGARARLVRSPDHSQTCLCTEPSWVPFLFSGAQPQSRRLGFGATPRPSWQGSPGDGAGTSRQGHTPSLLSPSLPSSFFLSVLPLSFLPLSQHGLGPAQGQHSPRMCACRVRHKIPSCHQGPPLRNLSKLVGPRGIHSAGLITSQVTL